MTAGPSPVRRGHRGHRAGEVVGDEHGRFVRREPGGQLVPVRAGRDEVLVRQQPPVGLEQLGRRRAVGDASLRRVQPALEGQQRGAVLRLPQRPPPAQPQPARAVERAAHGAPVAAPRVRHGQAVDGRGELLGGLGHVLVAERAQVPPLDRGQRALDRGGRGGGIAGEQAQLAHADGEVLDRGVVGIRDADDAAVRVRRRGPLLGDVELLGEREHGGRVVVGRVHGPRRYVSARASQRRAVSSSPASRAAMKRRTQ